jgi:hypothetical protein
MDRVGQKIIQLINGMKIHEIKRSRDEHEQKGEKNKVFRHAGPL